MVSIESSSLIPNGPRSEKWAPWTWRSFEAHQQPPYEDPGEVDRVVSRLRTMPPLVFSGEVVRLKQAIARCAAGEAFLLHGGDCAERFAEVERDTVVRKLKMLLQMSLVLADGARKPVIRLARIAGQYAKPRSSDTELVNGQEMHAYRGDGVNDLTPTPEARRPDPSRLERAYFHSAVTLNFIRALSSGGFADLRHADHWDLRFLAGSPQHTAYQLIANRIRDALTLLGGFGALNDDVLERAEFFTSHEGLILPYEEALTARPPLTDRFYNLGAHLLWIGDRTRQLDGAHVEYFRGIANPIGVKVGPTCSPEELVELIERLNPEDEPGRISLITRMGAHQVNDRLPQVVRAVKRSGHLVQWSVDPMHGNGMKTKGGVKTRNFSAIMAETRAAFEIHAAEGTILSGVHFEMTGDDVSECIGGSSGPTEDDLSKRYLTGCDPRLNCAQSLEIAFLLRDLLRARPDRIRY